MIYSITIDQQDSKGQRMKDIGTVIVSCNIRHGRSDRTIPYLEGNELPFKKPMDSQIWREKTFPRHRVNGIHIIDKRS